jgi:hypothetical protein
MNAGPGDDLNQTGGDKDDLVKGGPGLDDQCFGGELPGIPDADGVADNDTVDCEGP